MSIPVFLSRGNAIRENNSWRCLIVFSVALLFTQILPAISWAQEQVASDSSKIKQVEIKQVVNAAFTATHDGFSSDEVILRSDLNKSFLEACQKELKDVDAFQFNWTLLNLRKAGKLTTKATKRAQQPSDSDSDSIRPVAEMCARMMEDKHGKSIDRLMADPETRQQFDDAAIAIDADVDTYLVRKAAFTLRKVRKLKPELITRIADWGRVVTEHKASEYREQIELAPESPGIYIFRDASGYLYIGEAIDLRERLNQHLNGSDRKSLSSYLAEQGFDDVTIEIHTFADDSRIKELKVRRAYESELIRSREPRFNVRP